MMRMSIGSLKGSMALVVAILGATACSHAPSARRAPAQDTATASSPFGLDERRRGVYVNETEPVITSFAGSAKKTLDIEIYEMSDFDFRAMLRRHLSNGVRVRIVKDPLPLGETCRYFEPIGVKDDDDCQDQKKLVSEVNAAGGSFVPFKKPDLCAGGTGSCYEHGKMIIVDGSEALLSTGNFNSSNLCNLSRNPDTCNRDYAYVTGDSDTVATLSAIFENDIAGIKYDVADLLKPAVMGKLTVSPYSLKPLVEFINRAQRTIQIENQYLTEPTINAALMDKARAGVRVTLTLASACSFGRPDSKKFASAQKIYEPMDAAGIETRMFNSANTVGGRKGYMHAKVIVVDRELAWMGSVNGSPMSTSHNREYGVFIRNPEMVQKLAMQLDADHTQPNVETWQESLRCTKDRSVPKGLPDDDTASSP